MKRKNGFCIANRAQNTQTNTLILDYIILQSSKHSIHSKSVSFGSFCALVDGSINTATISQTICWEVRTAEKCWRPVIKGIVT